jgi:hypothetical protein
MKTPKAKTAAASVTTGTPFFQKGNGGNFFAKGDAQDSFFSTEAASLVQPKLTIGAPNDKYEKEADDMAEQVVQRTEKEKIQSKNIPGGQASVFGKHADTLEHEADSVAEKVARRPSVAESSGKKNGEAKPVAPTVTPVVQTKCSSCEEDEVQKKEEDILDSPKELQRKPIFTELPDPPDNPADTGKNHSRSSLKVSSPNSLTTVQAKPIFESDAEPVDRDIQTKALDTTNRKDEFLNGVSWEEEQADKPILFKLESNIQRSGEAGPTDEASVRNRIEQIARGEIGKVEAKRTDPSGRRVGADRLLEYFHVAAPGEWPDEVIELGRYGAEAFPSWCGIFTVYVIKTAGIDVGDWKMGTGVSQFNTLVQTDTPQKGDIGYIHEPYRHHCLVMEVSGSSVKTIDGNSGLASEVIENTRPLEKFTAFFTAFTGSQNSVQRKEESSSSPASSRNLESNLTQSKGSGSTLDKSTRSEMESAFGADFGNVKIHTNSAAVNMSKDLHAQAFTHGSDIYFNEGKFNTSTAFGKNLLAHELTHTLQQGAVSRKPIQKTGETNAAPATPAAPTPDPQYIVEDTVTAPEASQMKKTVFLNALITSLRDAAQVAFSGMPYQSYITQPLVDGMTTRFQNLNAVEVENTIKAEVPAETPITAAQNYIQSLTTRFNAAVNQWLTDGSLEGLPEYIVNAIPQEIKDMGRLNRVLVPLWRTASNIVTALTSMGNAITETISSAGDAVVNVARRIGSGIASLFTKSTGGSKGNQSPAGALSRLGKGKPLNSGVRNRMEGAFGKSFSDVTIHDDASASGLAGNMNAKAFAVGPHIGFGTGEYKPGSVVGDALIAHELAHVNQQRQSLSSGVFQKGTVSETALEKDADSTAVGVVSKLWGRGKEVVSELKNWVDPKASTGLGIHSCSTEMVTDEEKLRLQREQHTGASSAGVSHDYTIEELTYMLDQLNENVDTYSAMARDTRITICGGGMASANSMIANLRGLDAAMQRDPDTFPAGMNFEELELLFLIKFKERAKSTTLQMLEANERVIQSEKDRAAVTDTSGRLTSLYTELAPVRALGDQIEEQNEANRELLRIGRRGPIGTTAPDRRIAELKQQAVTQIASLTERFPMLADPELSGANLGYDMNRSFPMVSRANRQLTLFNRMLFGDINDLSLAVTRVSDARLEDIRVTREGINADPSKIFILERIVQLTKDQLHFQPGSIQERIIDNKISEIQMETIFRNVAVAALGIGFAIMSGGAGAIAALGALGSVAVSAGQLYESVSRYRFESSAAASHYDRAQAVASEAGSPLWIALDVVGLIGDVAGAVKVARAIARSAEAARLARASAETMERLAADARRIGQEVAGEGLVRTAAQVEEMAQQAVRRQLAQQQALADPANAAALARINTAIPTIDDAGRYGLLQLEEGLRTKVLSLPSDVALLIAHSTQRSASFRSSLHMIGEALDPAVFSQVMPTIMRGTSGQELLEVIHSAGLSADDLRRIDFSRVTTGFYQKFRDGVYDLLSRRISADLDDIEQLARTLENLHPSQRRAIMVRFINQQTGLPVALRNQIIASSDLQQILRNHSFNTNQILTWWNEFNAGPRSGTFLQFAEARSGVRFSGRVSQPLSEFINALPPGTNTLNRHLGLLNITEPRLATALREGTLPQPLAQRLREVLENPDLLGQARTVAGARNKVTEALNEAMARNVQTPQDLQRIMQLINEPGSRGSIGEHFARYHLLGPGTAAAGTAHVSFRSADIPGLTVDPFRPDRIRSSARRTLDIKAGYEATSIDIEQARNYQRLIDQSRIQGSAVQTQLNQVLNTPTGGGLMGHDYLFLTGPGGNPRAAAESAFQLLETNGLLRHINILFQDMDGTIKQVVRDVTTGNFSLTNVGRGLVD